MIISGSTTSTNLRHSSNKDRSSLNSRTCEPTMWEQVFSVNTFRTKGLLSPEHERGSLTRRHTLPRHHCCNLDHGIYLSFGEDAFSTGALDVEAQDTQWRKSQPVALWCMRDQILVAGCQHCSFRPRLTGMISRSDIVFSSLCPVSKSTFPQALRPNSYRLHACRS